MQRRLHLPEIKLRHLVYAVLIYCGIVAAVWPRRTYDIWWHLAAGRWMVQNQQIPHEDPFTWSRQGEAWTAHEWAWELPMYALYSRWGHDGLMALRVLVGAVTCGLLAWLLLRKGATPLVAMAVGALAIFAARPLFNDRPQAATMPFFVAMLCLIEQSEQGKQRWLLIGAPLLMVAWVNIHGGFIYGPALLGLYALCKAPRWIMQWRGKQSLAPCPGMVLGAIALSVIACVANPNFIEGAVYPMEYVTGGHSWHKTFISEYKSPDFSGDVFAILGYLIVGATAVFAASSRRASLWEIALVSVFLYTALNWQRNAALFAFAVAPLLALQGTELMGRIGLSRTREQPEERSPTVLYWAIVVALVVAAGMSLPTASQRAEERFGEDMPVESVQYIQETGLQGRMLNTYRWGGYLIWHLWPEHRVMIDGRADVMGRTLAADWQKAHKLLEGWEQVLDDYAIDWALVEENAPLVRGLEEHPDWRLAFEESSARLFVRKGSVADRTAEPGHADAD